MEWLVIGSGVIGQGLMRYLPNAVQMRRPDHDLRTIRDVPPTDQGVAVICGAVTGFKQCEMFPAWSREINVRHTLRVAELAHDRGWSVVMLSSQAAANPSTEYGWQKASVEAQWSFGPILRLPKILHREHALFYQWFHELSHDRIIRPFSDYTIQPITVPDVADAVRALAHMRGALMFEVPGPTTTYFHVASEWARQQGFDQRLIVPQLSDLQYPLMSGTMIRNVGWIPPTFESVIQALI